MTRSVNVSSMEAKYKLFMKLGFPSELAEVKKRN